MLAATSSMSLTRAPPELPGLIAVPAWIMPAIWLVALARHRRAAENHLRADAGCYLLTTADTLDDPGAMTRVRQAYDMLTGEVWPHEAAEEAELYPSLNRLLGGADPTAPMSRAHAEIGYQIARLGRLTSATAPPTRTTSPICAVSCTGCTPSCGCTPCRRMRPTCRSVTVPRR